MKHKIYISRLEYLENRISLAEYKNIKTIKIIDPKHKEMLFLCAEIFLECKEKDLICLLIETE